MKYLWWFMLLLSFAGPLDAQDLPAVARMEKGVGKEVTESWRAAREKLRQNIARDGYTLVYVTMAFDYEVEAVLRKRSERDFNAQEMRKRDMSLGIKSALESVYGIMPNSFRPDVFGPGFAVRVNDAGLDVLLSDPRVRIVQEPMEEEAAN